MLSYMHAHACMHVVCGGDALVGDERITFAEANLDTKAPSSICKSAIQQTRTQWTHENVFKGGGGLKPIKCMED